MKNFSDQDKEANHFAMCLLMPKDWVLDAFEEMFPNGIELTNEESPLQKLADKFQVTETMMWIRLGQLGVMR